mmetsp:Transcript_24222/g.59730  ORF Transcript_24222/g.59730 Transcript_24222/m.59730 type:complete len:85 (+) Transcript_24222:876-1130(+)
MYADATIAREVLAEEAHGLGIDVHRVQAYAVAAFTTGGIECHRHQAPVPRSEDEHAQAGGIAVAPRAHELPDRDPDCVKVQKVL